MITARELADRLQATLHGDERQWDAPLAGIASLERAGRGHLSFLAQSKYRSKLPGCGATAILIKPEALEQAPAEAALIVVDDPYLAYARVSALFSRESRPDGRIHARAAVDDSAVLGRDVTVGANAVIGPDCQLGDGCVVEAGCVLGARVRLGASTRLRANVTVLDDVEIGARCLVHAGTVIGSDGFGFAPAVDGWHKIAQLGRVLIGDDVEIGANCAIDRGAIEDTVIEDGVIIDNLVHLAHNVRLGKGSAIAAQVGIAGSATLGPGCTIGGQSGLAGHIQVAGQSHFTGQTMVTKGTSEPGVYSSGWPMQPNREWRRTVVRLRQLEQFERRLNQLEKAQQPTPSTSNPEEHE